MPRQLKGRQAVFLVVPPDDWKPQSLWDIPPSFTSGKLYAKNLPMRSALGFARTHNKAAVERLQAGQRESWAIVSRHLRPNWRNRPQGVKGGAQ